MRVLVKTKETVTVAVAVKSADKWGGVTDPNVARIAFGKSDIAEYRNCISAMISCGWPVMKKYDYRAKWLYDEEIDPLKSDPAEWEDPATHTEMEMIELWDDGDIYFSAYIKHTDFKLTCEHIKLVNLEALFETN